MTPLAVSAYTLTTALGRGRDRTLAALRAGAQRPGAAPFFESSSSPPGSAKWPASTTVRCRAELEAFDCRNNRLAWLGLQQDGFARRGARARERWGAQRVGVFLGTSTSGILQTELAYRRRAADGCAARRLSLRADAQHRTRWPLSSRRRSGSQGPSCVVSTACSSSAKVYGNAARLIDAGLIDAAVVGGVDSLCLTTLYGFNSLELLAADICRPWDADRHGLSLGEAAAFALLERETSDAPQGLLLGVGESSDGYHMSSPHPDGAGAVEAMRAALAGAQLDAASIDYINLHGTATPNNDAAEDRAVCAVFGNDTAVQLDQGRHRPHARRCRRRRGRDQPARAAARVHPRRPEPAHARRGPARRLPQRKRRCAAAHGAQQFVRLRRLEREPRLRSAR